METAVATGRAPSPGSPRRQTIEDWLAVPEERRAELIDGCLVYHAMPGPVHGRAQMGIGSILRRPFDRRRGAGDPPGGWWISMEVDMEIAGMGCRPDLVAWRRDKHPTIPEPDRRGVVTEVPDWVCEVLSKSSAKTDLGPKRVGYHRAGIAHYWVVDPMNETLTVLAWTEQGYLMELVAARGDEVRAAPFDAIELDAAELFGELELEAEAEPPPEPPP